MSSAALTIHTLVGRARAEVTAFAAWWWQEVRDAWTALFERLVPARSQRFVLQVATQQATLRKIRGERNQPREFALAPDDDLPPLHDVWPQGAPRRALIDVVLPESAALVWDLRLPPVADREIARAVELQLERELPLPREMLYVGWKVRDKRPDQSRIVAIAAARRADVERFGRGIRAWGWRVASVSCQGAQGQALFNLLPPLVARLRVEAGRREVLLLRSAAALALAYFLVVAGQWWYERASLAQQLQQAHAQLSDIDRGRAVLSRVGKPIDALQEIMRRQSSGEALVALSAVVPQDSWIYQVDIRAPASGPVVLSLEGYTPAATSLVQMIEQSPQFEQVELVESGSAGLGADRQRVRLTAHLRTSARK